MRKSQISKLLVKINSSLLLIAHFSNKVTDKVQGLQTPFSFM